MRQRREIAIHIFELAYATVSYEPCVDRHHASTFVAAVTTRLHSTIALRHRADVLSSMTT